MLPVRLGCVRTQGTAHLKMFQRILLCSNGTLEAQQWQYQQQRWARQHLPMWINQLNLHGFNLWASAWSTLKRRFYILLSVCLCTHIMVRENAVLAYLIFIFAYTHLVTVMGHFKYASVASNRSWPIYESLGEAFQDTCESQIMDSWNYLDWMGP